MYFTVVLRESPHSFPATRSSSNEGQYREPTSRIQISANEQPLQLKQFVARKPPSEPEQQPLDRLPSARFWQYLKEKKRQSRLPRSQAKAQVQN
jgi:hypothetical protein